MSDILGLALYILIVAVGLVSTGFAAKWTWGKLMGWNVAPLPAMLLTILAIVAGLGGFWLLFDVAWIVTIIVDVVRGGSDQGGPPSARQV